MENSVNAVKQLLDCLHDIYAALFVVTCYCVLY